MSNIISRHFTRIQNNEDLRFSGMFHSGDLDCGYSSTEVLRQNVDKPYNYRSHCDCGFNGPTSENISFSTTNIMFDTDEIYYSIDEPKKTSERKIHG